MTSFPIFNEPPSTMSIYKFFFYCLSNSIISSKHYAFKLYDCKINVYNLSNLVYSFLGFTGPILILVQHHDKTSDDFITFGMFINSNFKECFSNFCGDDLSHILIVGDKMDILKTVGDDHEHYERYVPPAEIELRVERGEPYLRPDVLIGEYRDGRGKQELGDYLLIRLEAEVPLLLRFYKVVKEADKPEPDHYYHGGEGIAQGDIVIRERERSYDYRKYEHYPAHRGGPLLRGMSVRALRALDLPVF